jgi:hypothetical protein
VRLPGTSFVMKVLAATEAELEEGAERFAQGFFIPRELLVADLSEGWPFDRAFPF